MNRGLVFFLLFFVSVSSFTQQFDTKKILVDDGDKKLFLTISGTSFLKNNEYDNQFTKGFTGVGIFIQPTINYYLSSNTKLDLGLHMLKYAGDSGFNQVIPLISIQQKINKNLDLFLGKINGTLSHQIQEPMLRFDNYYENNIEYGLQFWYHSNRIESDLWVNWEKYIFKNSPFQESFTAGSVSEFKLISNDKFRLSVPLHLLFFHKGGQIDSSPLPILTMFNLVSGFDLKYRFDDSNVLGFESLCFMNKTLANPEIGENRQIFDKGNASYFKLNYRHKRIQTEFGYWNSEKFTSPKGEYLFLNNSEFNSEFSQNKKQLLTGKVLYNYKFSDAVNLVFNVDAYFDIDNSNLSHSAGLYLLIKDVFFLFENKKDKK